MYMYMYVSTLNVDEAYLSHIVEVSMWHHLLCLQLLVFVEHLVQVEPRLKVAQPPVCE